MPIIKYLEAVCDNCGQAIDHQPKATVPQMKRIIRQIGGVVQYDKVFCNTDCQSQWWVKRNTGQK